MDKPFYMMIIDRLLASLPNLMIANSMAGAALAVKRKEIAPGKVKVVYNGFDLDEFTNVPKTDIRAEFHLRPQQSLVGVIGRLEYPKGQDFFLEAFSRLVLDCADIKALLVGTGPERTHLETQAKQLGLRGRVIFTGVRKDVVNFLEELNVLVLPSYWEGLPNVLIEALSCGCPVVATRVGGVPELIEDEQTGLLVDAGDVNGLTIAIKRMLLDKSLQEHCIDQGKKMIATKTSLAQMVNTTQEIYTSIVFGRSLH
jgi:glycosyltransferase involved in cell wall biosynthesis